MLAEGAGFAQGCEARARAQPPELAPFPEPGLQGSLSRAWLLYQSLAGTGATPDPEGYAVLASLIWTGVCASRRSASYLPI